MAPASTWGRDTQLPGGGKYENRSGDSKDRPGGGQRRNPALYNQRRPKSSVYYAEWVSRISGGRHQHGKHSLYGSGPRISNERGGALGPESWNFVLSR